MALGAALSADKGEPRPLQQLITDLTTGKIDTDSQRMRPLFANEEEFAEFRARHDKEVIPQLPLSEARGRCFLGVDSGSTTIKAVVIDQDKRIVFTHYASNEGNPVSAAVEIVRRRPAARGVFGNRYRRTRYEISEDSRRSRGFYLGE